MYAGFTFVTFISFCSDFHSIWLSRYPFSHLLIILLKFFPFLFPFKFSQVKSSFTISVGFSVSKNKSSSWFIYDLFFSLILSENLLNFSFQDYFQGRFQPLKSFQISGNFCKASSRTAFPLSSFPAFLLNPL